LAKTIHKLRRENGLVVDFDKNQIFESIWQAVESVGGKDKKMAENLTELVVTSLCEKLKPNEMPNINLIQDMTEKILIESGHAKTAKAYILFRQKSSQIRKAKSLLGVKDDLNLSLNALTVLKRRHLKKDENGNVVETPQEMIRRVARAISEVDISFGKSKNEVKALEEQFFEMMSNLEFLPNSPTLMNAGTGLKQLSACFVLPVEDSIESIFGTLRDTALVQKSGGGTGFNFSKLRPKEDIVKTTGGIAAGPLFFVHAFDSSLKGIKQGFKRYSTNMGILNVDHPDVFDFIMAKEKEGILSTFNLSVGLTDKFMKAVKNDKEYFLINPKTGKKTKTMKARAVWNLIITMAWKNGEPGVVFIDRMNKHNPTPQLGKIESTNPCITKDALVSTEDGLIQINKLHNPYKVLTKDGDFHKISWAGKTGLKEVFSVKTKAGYEIKTTSNHKFLTSDGNWKPVKDLTKEDKIVIKSGKFGSLHIEKELALMLGWLVGDGYLSKDLQDVIFYFNNNEKKEILPVFKKYLDRVNKKNVKPITHGNEISLKYSSKIAKIFYDLGLKPVKFPEKEIPKNMFIMDKKSVKNFLSALFSADGSVQGNRKKGVSIRLSSSSLKLLKQTQLLLLQFGIFSKVYENRRGPRWKKLPDSNRKPKPYFCKAEHELIISRKSMFKFMDEIGFYVSSKRLKFERIKPQKIYRDNLDFHIEKIQKIGLEDVYDLTEPFTHSFVANGFVIHNCGEVPLLPYESCNLGSINLSKMVEDEKINWDKLKKTVQLTVYFLDNVIDANKYPLNEIEKASKSTRKIGLGVMGFADMLIELGISYNSEQGVKTAEKIMKFISEIGIETSVKLGEEKGNFPVFKESIWDKKGYKNMRNATITTIAPTSNLSIIAGCSSGIEPLFAISYVRNVANSLGENLIETNSLFEKSAIQQGIYSEDLKERILTEGSLKNIKEIPENMREVFITAHDISPEWHVKMQAAFQKYTHNAVSKTVNFTNHATPQDIENVYMLAYDSGCKGMTVYRDGSRQFQIIQTLKKNEGEKNEGV